MPFDLLEPAVTHDLTTGRGRLAYIADVVLERVIREDKPFDIGSWFSSYHAADDFGTAACAMGWACRDHLLQEQGLMTWAISPAFGGSLSFDAVAKFLKIDCTTAMNLFDGGCYYALSVTPLMVQTRIREYLAQIA